MIPKQVVNPYKPINDSLDKISLSRNSSDMSDRTPLLNNGSSKDSFKKDSLKRNINKLTLNTNGCSTLADHEYHEISEDDGLRSPNFDFGPSLMTEIFKEINPGLNTLENEFNLKNSHLNETKNEKAESKLHEKSSLPIKKKQALVKPISAAEEQSLDSAIAMVKEMATKSMFSHFDLKDKNDMSLTLLDNCSIIADSPRFSVTSPTKKKFTFKFKSSKEQKTFSDQLVTKQTDNIADSLLTQETKEAYESLIDSGATSKKSTKNELKESKKSNYPLLGDIKSFGSGKAKGIFSKNLSRNNLPKPPPIPIKQQQENTSNNLQISHHQMQETNNLINNQNQKHHQQQQQLAYPPNPLPLPPRSDRTKSLIQLKHHERRHPLIIPDLMDGCSIMNSLQQAANNKLFYDNNTMPKQLMSTFKPNMPLHRNVSFNEATKQNNTAIDYNSSPAQYAQPANLIK